MKNTKGFTLIEVMIVIAIVAITALAIAGGLINNMGATEKRGYETAQHYITSNHIEVKRITCAGDSDHDGYSTCTVVTPDEKIYLQCPASWGSVNLWGATSCKEVDMSLMQFKGMR